MNVLYKIWSIIRDFTKKLWKFLTNLNPSILVVLLISATAFFMVALFKYSHLEKEKNKIVYVLNDTIEQYKNKANEEYIAKNTYVVEIDDLKKSNKELSEEIIKLKDSPIVVTKTEIVYVHDTIYARTDSISEYEGEKIFHWSAKDSTFLHIAGVTSIKDDGNSVETTVSEVGMSTNLTVNLIETDDNQLKTIVKSDNPYMTINNINSAVLDPSSSKVLKSYFKPKKFGIGPYIGAGVSVNPTSGQVYLAPSVGIAVHYDILQF